MTINNLAVKIIFLLSFVLIVGACVENIEEDPCFNTKWLQPREYEIKLAVNVLPSNPQLSGGAPGSQSPVDFEKMVVHGTINKVDCSGEKFGINNLGNTYINVGFDVPAPINVPEAFWIGSVVYVYELGNDKDNLKVNLTVTITMKDNQSYACNVTDEIYNQQIVKVPGELYYYILIEIYSDNWVKV